MSRCTKKIPIVGGNTTLFKLKNGKYIRRKKIGGGNTNLYHLKKGKYVRKKVQGGGIFGTIMKHVNQHKGKILSVGQSMGKKVLKEAKNQLQKPENRRLLNTVTDQLIDKVAGKLGEEPPSRKNKKKRSRSFRGDLLAVSKKEAKKVARKKTRQLVNNFTKYVE
jgi:hypothetical protein